MNRAAEDRGTGVGPHGVRRVATESGERGGTAPWRARIDGALCGLIVGPASPGSDAPGRREGCPPAAEADGLVDGAGI